MDTSPRPSGWPSDCHLSAGAHLSPDDGVCLMEAVSRAAHLPWSDAPRCTHPLLAHLARLVNDASSDDGRQRLGALVPALADARPDGPDSAGTTARVAEACTAVALRRRPTLLLVHLNRVAAAHVAREDGVSASPGLVARARRGAFARGPAARAVEAAVGAVLHAPVPERDGALRELLEVGLAAARRDRQPRTRHSTSGSSGLDRRCC